MSKAAEKLDKIANFDVYFRKWIRASRAEGISDEQILKDLERLVKLVEVSKETAKQIGEGANQ